MLRWPDQPETRTRCQNLTGEATRRHIISICNNIYYDQIFPHSHTVLGMDEGLSRPFFSPFTPSTHLTFNICPHVSLSPTPSSFPTSYLHALCLSPLSLSGFWTHSSELWDRNEWEIVIFPYVRWGSGLFWGGRMSWGSKRGRNWRMEDSLSACINHEYRAAERLQPG